MRKPHTRTTWTRIRAAKDTGRRNLPCTDIVRNDTWLQLVLIALDLIGWTQALGLQGPLAAAEPKPLRHRVFHAAATIAHTVTQWQSGKRTRSCPHGVRGSGR